ncbi:hypothetical protein, partial [Acetobacter indonesiensis]|uniref:hypothetical protein n=1 Tax=Acetobacter indonesiensis TaxID=104101 RepID=UPI0022322556
CFMKLPQSILEDTESPTDTQNPLSTSTGCRSDHTAASHSALKTGEKYHRSNGIISLIILPFN